jgi:hypothetical protein
MTDNASPDRKPRPTRFPAQISAMVTEEMKAAIDVAAEGSSQGEVIRSWLERGRIEEHLDAEAAVHTDGSTT